MIRRRDGFTLIELLVALAIFVLTIAAMTGVFIPLVNQFKQQSKIAETNIEGVVGLELMRVEIEHAGAGLPWDFQNPGSIAYAEAKDGPASGYNDAPSQVPRGIVSGNGAMMNGSDYLVIRSAVAGTNATSQMWTYITQPPGGGAVVLQTHTAAPWNTWSPYQQAQNQIPTGSGVIVMDPDRKLIMSGAAFSTSFVNPLDGNFSPFSNTYNIYGLTDPGFGVRMPFNRADFYVGNPDGSAQFPGALPARCAPGTGVLYKATVSHTDGSETAVPLLDCVADMQVFYGLDTNGDGVIDSTPDDISDINLYPSAVLRAQLLEVRVFIITHEGQRDSTFQFQGAIAGNPSKIREGDTQLGWWRDFDVATLPAIGVTWRNYRWKLYTMVVRTANLNPL